MKDTNNNQSRLPLKYEKVFSKPNHRSKHVSFSCFDEIIRTPIHQISSQDSFNKSKPIPILKRTHNNHPNYHRYFDKINDLFYLLLLITFLLLFEKVLNSLT